MTQPLLCRLEAFDWFSQQLPILFTTDGLLHAAIAVSMHAMDDVDPREVDNRLDMLARRVKSRVRGNRTSALLANLHEVLFEEEGFFGNCESYYQPINCFLPVMLETRRGMPVSLSLLYKVVAQRVGLEVEGIHAPGHFMVRVRDERGWMIIDPFFGGVNLNEDEAFQRIEHGCLRPVTRSPKLFRTATHEQWVGRILANLQHIFTACDYRDDLAAMTELQALLRRGAW